MTRADNVVAVVDAFLEPAVGNVLPRGVGRARIHAQCLQCDGAQPDQFRYIGGDGLARLHEVTLLLCRPGLIPGQTALYPSGSNQSVHAVSRPDLS